MTRAVIYCRCSTERGVPEGCAYKTGGGGKRMRPPPELVLRG